MKSGQFFCLFNRWLMVICLSSVAFNLLAEEAAEESPWEETEESKTRIHNTTFDPVDDTLLDLLRVLDEETKIATHTKMNIDFVPGMVSILHGNDLLARGKRTVYDALALIPGIELSHTHDGQLQVIIRGVGKTFSSAKVKFLLNDIPFNTTLNAFSTGLIIPLEQVDRIEVIRGPGSVIYGEFASVGVVNIITHQEATTNQVYTRLSSVGNRYTVGGQLHEVFDDGKSSMTINFSQYETEGSDLKSGADILAGTPNAAVSNAPGDVNDAELNRSFIMDLQLDQYHVTWNFIERSFGDFYGITNALPSYNSKIIRTLSMQGLEISRPWKFAKNFKSSIKFGWSNYVFDSDQAELFPVGFVWPGTGGDPGVDGTFENGMLGAPNYVEDKYYFGTESEYLNFIDHEILLGFDFSKTQQGDTYAERNYNVGNVVTEVENQIYTGASNWMAENLSRRVVGLYVQDQYALTDQWVLTAGVRFDDYDDIDGDFTPRIAAVYQYSDSQTFKVQFAQSFRPPTFLEMYVKNNTVVSGNPDLESEELENVEFGYIFNNGVRITRATLFWYELENLIAIDPGVRRYANRGKVSANGVEYEYQRQLKSNIKFDGNFSYTRAELDGAGQIPGVAKLMANIGLIYQPRTNISVSGQYRYVGQREREASDTRASLDAYGTVDMGINVTNLLGKHITVRGFANNIFDEEIKAPAFLVQNRIPYQDDYQFSERTFELQLVYEFK